MGKRFYLRSRHDEWTFSVAETENVDPVGVNFPDQEFVRLAPYGEQNGFDAGYMSLGEAEEIIRKCAAEYFESHRE